MSNQTEFNRVLDRLYERRTDALRHFLAGKPGPLLTLTKKRRESKIRELQEIAAKALAKNMTKRAFRTLVVRKKTWRTKGWGTDKKQKIFRDWVRRKVSSRRGKIYVFWRKREVPVRRANSRSWLSTCSSFQKRLVQWNDPH